MATSSQRIVVTLPRPDGEDVTVELPSRWEICSHCSGHGRSCAYLGAITMAQWHRDWDEDEREAYMRGEYDRPCAPCGGSGKVLALAVDGDTDDLPELQREAIERYRQDRCDDRLERDILRAEARLLGDY